MPLQWGRVCQAQRDLETPFRAGTVSLQTAPPPKAGLRTGGIKPKKGIVGVFTKEGRPAVLLAGRAGGRAATAQPTGLGAHSPACSGLPLSAQGQIQPRGAAAAGAVRVLLEGRSCLHPVHCVQQVLGGSGG